MEEEDQKELQLLPTVSIPSSSRMSSHPSNSSSFRYRSMVSDHHHHHHNQFEAPSLDLQLSISVRPIQPPSNCVLSGQICEFGDVNKCDTSSCVDVESLKWQAAEQIRLAAIEKAYAERVRELTRREMELAQSEFARARQMWERAREEVEKAERMKERATKQIDSTCMEITCQSCRQRFRP
ncbi:zinc finger protein SHOOT GRAVITROPISM 5 [Pistacia vera]|uniref:zinc finger protein SHOOT GRAVITROPISM 5 n=1 Tax=Pistacia vera TaxID=55513 RepID=UPI0012636333|nr:zinc finger protein SHOOT GRAVITROPISM 5 [Pistacia vera]